MKKYTILPILALALGFAACDDVELGTGIPVVNPELPAAGPDLVTVAAPADMPAVAQLVTYIDKGENVPVAVASAAEGWPEGYGFGATAQVSADESFSSFFTLPVVVNGDNFAIDAAALNEGVRDNISKNPVETELWLRYNVSAVKGNENIVLGGPDTFYGPTKLTVVTTAPRFIDQKYYFMWSADGNDWNQANSSEFTHSDNNVYDDPVFSQILDLSAATVGKGIYWKIFGESYFTNTDYSSIIGVTDADKNNAKGALDPGATQVAGFMTLSGPVEFRIDMDNLTFEYKEAIPNFWLAGNGVNGTTWDDRQFAMVMWTENYTDYAGYANLYGADQPEFKFSPTNAWNGDFGVSGALEFTTNPDTGVLSATGKADGGGNVKVPAPGLYFISLNYSTRDLTVTAISTVGIIGDFNGWAASEPMTPSADNLTWKATVTMSAGNAWKFRMNNGWDINLGGNMQSLTGFGNPANLVCEADGTYEITLNLATLPYTATMVKK